MTDEQQGKPENFYGNPIHILESLRFAIVATAEPYRFLFYQVRLAGHQRDRNRIGGGAVHRLSAPRAGRRPACILRTNPALHACLVGHGRRGSGPPVRRCTAVPVQPPGARLAGSGSAIAPAGGGGPHRNRPPRAFPRHGDLASRRLCLLDDRNLADPCTLRRPGGRGARRPGRGGEDPRPRVLKTSGFHSQP